MKKLIVLAFLCISTSTYAQKIKVAFICDLLSKDISMISKELSGRGFQYQGVDDENEDWLKMYMFSKIQSSMGWDKPIYKSYAIEAYTIPSILELYSRIFEEAGLPLPNPEDVVITGFKFYDEKTRKRLLKEIEKNFSLYKSLTHKNRIQTFYRNHEFTVSIQVLPSKEIDGRKIDQLFIVGCETNEFYDLYEEK
jgi:hypothetical protein